MNSPQKNPYIGPRTFLKEEGHLFFGREREARDLLSLVVSQHLVLFYAQSGAGKSSIVNTRLIPSLEEKGFEVLPVGRVSGDLPPEGVNSNVFTFNLMRKLTQHEADSNVLASLTLSEFLTNLNSDEKGYFYDPDLAQHRPTEYTPWRHALVIDQFEEIFSTHPEAWEKREDFFCQLADAMEEDTYLWVVLVMREDYIASLDPYAHLLPGGLRVRYYMQRLGREAALKAIKNPVENLRPYAPNVAEKLVDDLCRIKVQKPDGSPGVEPGQYVEPVQLQVVCYSLWENLGDGTLITEEDLREVGDVNQSLGRYYAGRVKAVAADKNLNVKERSIREWFEKSLITAGGIRNMVLQEPGKKSGGLLEDRVIQALQSDLVRAEKRSGATWYELTHDRLVEPILADNKLWFEKNSSLLQRQAKLWNDQGRSEGLLLRDQALSDAVEWAQDHEGELTQSDRDLIRASQEYQDQIEKQKTIERMKLEQAEEQAHSAMRARRLTRVAFSLLGLALIAVAFAVVANVKVNKNAETIAALATQGALDEATANKLASEARARELAGQGADNLGKQLDLSILLGLEAFNKNLENPKGEIIPQVERALFDNMQRSARLRGFLATSQDPVTQLQYSPDGKRIAIHKKDGITLWDIGQNMVAESIPNSRFATQYFFSHDSSTLLFLDYNGITFWDVKNSKKLNSTPMNGHKGAVMEIVYSAGGESFATVGENGDVTLWDAKEKSVIVQPDQVKAHAFSPDGRKFAVLDRQGNIMVYDMANGRQKTTIAMEPDTVTALAFNQAGDTLAIGDKNGGVVLWNLNENEEKDSFSIGALQIFSLDFSSDGIYLVYQTPSGVQTWSLEKHQQSGSDAVPVTGSLIFSPSGKVYAELSNSGQIFLHDIPEGAPRQPIPGTNAAFSMDGNSLAAFNARDKSLKLFDVSTGKQMGDAFPEQTDSLMRLAFSRDGKSLAVTTPDGSIKVWDVTGRSNLNLPSVAEKSPALALAFSPDSRVLLAGTENSSLVLWDQKDYHTEKIETGYIGSISSITASPDGQYVFSVARDGIELIDLETLKPVGDMFPGSSIVFSEDEKVLAVIDFSTESGQCSLWSIPDHRKLKSAIPCTEVKFSPTGERVAVTNYTDKSAPMTTLWDTQAGKALGKSVDGYPVSFSPDGATLAISDSNLGVVTLWNARTGDSITDKPILASNVNFSSQGNTVVLTDYSNNITVINRATGEMSGKLSSTAFVELSPDGKILIAQDTTNGSLSFWDAGTLKQIDDPIINVTSWIPSLDKRKISVTTYYSTTIWDVATAKQVGSFPVVGSLQFSPHDDYVVSSEYYGNALSLWNLATDEKLSLGSNQTFPPGISPFTPDGKYLLLFDSLNSGYVLWSLATGKQVGERMAGHAGWVTAGAFNPSGSVQVTVQDNSLLYTNANIMTGDVSRYSFLLSPDEESYAVLNAADGSASLWSIGSPPSIPGEEIQGLKEYRIQNALLSPDGSTLAAATQNGVMLWDIKSDAQIGELPPLHLKQPNSVNLSPNGGLAAISYVDNSLSLWDLKKDHQIGEPITENFAGFSPDGRTLITSPNYQLYKIRDTSTGKTIGEPVVAESYQFTRDGHYLVFYSYYGGNIRIFDAASGTQVGEPLQGSLLGIGPSDALIVIQDEKSIVLRDVSHDMQIKSYIPNDGKTYFVLSANGKYLAATSSGSKLVIRDIETLKEIGQIDDYSGEQIIFSPDGQFLYFYNYTQGGLALYQTISPNKRIVEGNLAGDTVTFSPDGKLFTSYYAYNYSDPEITLYSTSTGEKVDQVDIRGNLQGFANGGELMITLKDGKRVNLWETDDLTGRSTPVKYDGTYGGLTVSQDGSSLAVYGSSGVLVMNLADPKHSTQPIQEKTGIIQQMMFSPDGKILATIGSDGLLLWDVKTRLPIHKTILSEESYISNAKFSPDGKKIVYLNGFGNAFEIDLGTANEVREATELLTLNQACAIGFNPENQLLAVKQNAGKLRILNQSTNEFTDLNLDGSCGNPMAFGPDGASFAYNNGDRTYIFTSDAQGKPFAVPRDVFGDQAYYYNLNFVLDDQVLSMNAPNGRIYFWDVKSRSLIFASDESANLTSVLAGRALLLLPSENRLVSLDFAPASLRSLLEGWKKELCMKAGRNFSSAEWRQYFADNSYRTTCPQWGPGK